MPNWEGSKVKKLFLQAEDKAIQHFSRLVNIDEKVDVKTDVDTVIIMHLNLEGQLAVSNHKGAAIC